MISAMQHMNDRIGRTQAQADPCQPPGRRGWWRVPGLLLALALLGPGAPALAQGMDVALVAAHAQKSHISKLGLVLGFTRPEPLWQGQRWRLLLRHEGELAAWRVPLAHNLVELGYSPVLRMERPLAAGGAFFAEASIGVRLVSHTRLSDTRAMSTAFQFADMLGLGWRSAGRAELGLRLQHISNASIKRPNSGVNFVLLYYRQHF